MENIKSLFSRAKVEDLENDFSYWRSPFRTMVLPFLFLNVLLMIIRSYTGFNVGFLELYQIVPASVSTVIAKISLVIFKTGNLIYKKYWWVIFLFSSNKIICSLLVTLFDRISVTYYKSTERINDYYELYEHKEHRFSLLYLLLQLRKVGWFFLIDYWLLYSVSELIVNNSLNLYTISSSFINEYINIILFFINLSYFGCLFINRLFYVENSVNTKARLIKDIEESSRYEVYAENLGQFQKHYLLKDNYSKDSLYLYVKLITDKQISIYGSINLRQKYYYEWNISKKIESSSFEEVRFIYKDAVSQLAETTE